MRYIFAFWLLLTYSMIAAPEALISSLQRLKSIHDVKGRASDAEYLQASDQTLQLWSAADPEDKASIAHRMAFIHFERARRLAGSGNFKAAADELRAEAAIQQDFEGRLEFATKSPDRFFQDLVELQAQVTAETGSDPLVAQVGYSFEKDGDGFTAARLELGDDVAGITVPEVGDHEALALVYQLNKQDGKFVAMAPKWLVVPKGKLPDVLEQATHEVAFDPEGRMSVHNLKAQAGPFPKSSPSAEGNAASSPVPSHVQPPAPNMPTEQKPAPSTPGEKPALSTRWPVVAVVVMAMLGPLWVWLKKGK